MRTEATFEGRTALVTGGANGIGRACAVRLARAGAAVTVVDRDETAVKEVAELIGGRAVAANLLDPDTFDQADLAADILVNNAGFQHVAAVEDFPPQIFSDIVTLMLVVPFRLAQLCLPGMYAQGWGRIINISSVHGIRASPYKSAYVSAKHGLEGLSKTIALEGAPHGVTSNCVNPAYVRTALVSSRSPPRRWCTDSLKRMSFATSCSPRSRSNASSSPLRWPSWWRTFARQRRPSSPVAR